MGVFERKNLCKFLCQTYLLAMISKLKLTSETDSKISGYQRRRNKETYSRFGVLISGRVDEEEIPGSRRCGKPKSGKRVVNVN